LLRERIDAEGSTTHPNKTSVALVRIKDLSDQHISEGIEKCLDLIGFKLPDAGSVMIKPNMHYYFHPSTGSVTNPATVSALIDVLRKRNGNLDITIAEADASAMLTKHSFKVLGYERIAREKKVRLLNISEGEVIEKTVMVGRKELTIPVAREVLEADLLINVPTLKAHKLPTISCCLKNIYGAIPKRFKHSYHSMLNDVIVAANEIMKSGLCIVDGTYAFGKHPVKTKVLLAGINPVAVDSVAARCMGYNPRKIKHLRLAARERLGSFGEVEILGEIMPEAVSEGFPKISPALVKIAWGTQLLAFDIYRRLTSDTVPPPLED